MPPWIRVLWWIPVASKRCLVLHLRVLWSVLVMASSPPQSWLCPSVPALSPMVGGGVVHLPRFSIWTKPKVTALCLGPLENEPPEASVNTVFTSPLNCPKVVVHANGCWLLTFVQLVGSKPLSHRHGSVAACLLARPTSFCVEATNGWSTSPSLGQVQKMWRSSGLRTPHL